MLVSHLMVRNWRNFRSIDVDLGARVFLVGPNASGKSNFLDALRFLRDISKRGGGFQEAVASRGGVSKIRCLAARRYPHVEIDVTLSNGMSGGADWRYALGFQGRGADKAEITYERVWRAGEKILERPDEQDRSDPPLLTQTHLEQMNANAQFREIASFLESVLYLHLVPQLVRHPREYSGPGIPGDPFGRSFLERIAATSDRTRRARLKAIEAGLRLAVPQLRELVYITDPSEGGVPHLEAIYEHWRPHGAKQREGEFSDGTLRLIGLLWSLLERDSLLLLEEPELSLNTGIVCRLAPLIYRMQRKRKRQVIISTHSADLLSDKGIGPEEVLLLKPSAEGTEVTVSADDTEIRSLLEGGLNVAEATLPRTIPERVTQLELFE